MRRGSKERAARQRDDAWRNHSANLTAFLRPEYGEKTLMQRRRGVHCKWYRTAKRVHRATVHAARSGKNSAAVMLDRGIRRNFSYDVNREQIKRSLRRAALQPPTLRPNRQIWRRSRERLFRVSPESVNHQAECALFLLSSHYLRTRLAV
jgi:hypothetical protein